MNFFKSVFSDDPDPPSSEPYESSSSSNPTEPSNDYYESDPTTPSGSWSFGGLMKTLQAKSDWLDTYRRDLEEFGSGLKKETQVLREVASKAVKELPSSLDSIGVAVADIIAQGKESLGGFDEESNDGFDGDGDGDGKSVSSVGRYSRFDTQLRGIQSDVRSFVVEPEDVGEYEKWVSWFELGEMREEIEGLLKENGSLEGIYRRVVPDVVKEDVFWNRYFYRVYRLRQAESVRERLVKRAISTEEEEEEELSWDVDDDDEEEGDGSVANVSGEPTKQGEEENKVVEESHVEKSETSGEVEEGNADDKASKKLEKMVVERKSEAVESSKDSDISVVSTQPSTEEDDMGWDEIEDIGSDDDKKVARSKSPNREDLRKRLSAAGDMDDEDLSWDIEDDD